MRRSHIDVFATVAILAIPLICTPPKAFAGEEQPLSTFASRVHLSEVVRVTSQLSGEESALPIPDSSERSLPRRAKEYIIKTLPKHLFEGFKESFFRVDHLAALAVAGGAAAGLAEGADRDIRTFFREDRPFESGKEVGNTLGNTGVLFGLSALAFGAGELIGAPTLSETGGMMFEALAITAPVTALLKVSVDRERPDKSNDLSFPSAHASGSFAVATVLARQYGFLVGIPAYMTATWIAMSRVQKDKHFFSDSLFGAALGAVVGNAVVNVHRREKESSVSILPVISPHGAGIVVSVRY